MGKGVYVNSCCTCVYTALCIQVHKFVAAVYTNQVPSAAVTKFSAGDCEAGMERRTEVQRSN